ncbi:MAG: BspA family leucine-rich repeat surface protein [Clostridia bacterium]|nr:BspA family leucine-rich repeat surface protein [Clostridia bacterium]
MRKFRNALIICLSTILCVVLLCTSLSSNLEAASNTAYFTITMSPFNSESTNEYFVRHCYRIILKRDPDTTGLDYWVKELKNNSKTKSDVAKEMMFSNEYVSANYSDSVFVSDLYKLFENKEPDTQGYNYWIGVLKDNTLSRSSVFDSFAKASENNAKNNTDITLTMYYDNKFTTRPDVIGKINSSYTTSAEIPWDFYKDIITYVKVDSSMKNFKPTSTAYWFSYLKELKDIIGEENLNLSSCTNMEDMFHECATLTSLNTSNWNTSSVENMNYTFYNCRSITSLNVANWDISSVESMNYTFYNCNSLTALDVSNWNTSNVENMIGTFTNCNSLTTLNVANWDISSVESMDFTFYNCNSLTALDVSNWNTSNVENMTGTFTNCNSLTTLDVSNWNTSNMVNINGLFSGCESLVSLDVSNWDVSNVKAVGYTFFNCNSLTALDISNWNTSNVVYIYGLFADCKSLKSLDVSNWNTSNVVNMNGLFSECKSLKSLDVSNWNTSNVKDMGYVFYNCSSINNLNLSNWDTSNVEYMKCMFCNCSSLNNLNLSNWDTSNVVHMDEIFANCSKLSRIYVGKDWTTDSLYDFSTNYLFVNCESLKGENGTVFDSGYVDANFAHVDGGINNPGYFWDDLCDVTYNVGDFGTGSAPSQMPVKINGGSFKVANAPTGQDGYKFIEWTDGNKTYQPGDTYTVMYDDVVLTAKWDKATPTTPTNNNNSNSSSPSGNNSGTTPPPSTPTTTTSPNNSVTPVSTVVPAPTLPASELNVNDFVARCYQVALQREPEQEGYNYWVNRLNNGEACGAQVGFGFIFSGEYINRNRTNDEFVRDLYSMYFDREPDNDGYNYWMGLLADGLSREEVFAGFANSLEFYNLCCKYGVTCGIYVVGMDLDQQGGINCFVSRLYKVCLNRLPDMDGQGGWVMRLINGDVTGTTAAYGFVMSQEFTNLELDDVNFVAYMYRAFFGREAAQEEINGWAMNMSNGLTREDVFNGFAGSPEFFNLCANYGINV